MSDDTRYREKAEPVFKMLPASEILISGELESVVSTGETSSSSESLRNFEARRLASSGT